MQKISKRIDVRKLAVVGMLSAVASVLMMLEFSVPLVPSFLKVDFSELPALLAAFALGPISGAAVCLVKNLVHLFLTTTAGVGELSNFLLGICFVLPAGFVYQFKKTRGGAFIGALVGAAIMAIVSVFINYYITYPVYTNFMPMEAILGAYKAINPRVESLWDALIWFNVPFTFVKGLFSVAFTFAIYKPLSPILKVRR